MPQKIEREWFISSRKPEIRTKIFLWSDAFKHGWIAEWETCSTILNWRHCQPIQFRKLELTRCWSCVIAGICLFIQAKSDAIFPFSISQRETIIRSRARKIGKRMDENRVFNSLPLCRLCGISGNHRIDIFGKNSKNRSVLSEKIFMCVAIRVSVNQYYSLRVECLRNFEK